MHTANLEEIEPLAAPAATTQRRLPWSRRLLFMLLIAAAIGGFQEICFRVVFPLPEVPTFNRIHYTPMGAFEWTGMDQVPRDLMNVRVRYDSEPDGFSYEHALNLYGFRGPSFDIDPSPGRHRILFVGDSFLEGCGAPDDETIPQQFGQILRPRNVEAINLGVSGTGYQTYSRLVRDGLALLRPEAVFLVTCFNDMPAEPVREEDTTAEPYFDRRNDYAPRAATVCRRIHHHLPVPRRFTTGPYPFWAAVPSPINPFSWMEPGATGHLSKMEPPPNLDPMILDAMRRGRLGPGLCCHAEIAEHYLCHDFEREGSPRPHLQRLQELCRRHDVPLILVYIPYLCVVNPVYMEDQRRLGGRGFSAPTLSGPEYRQQQEHLRRVTAELGIPFLDATEVLMRAEHSGTRTYRPIDNHCTPAGYRFIAELCARHWQGMIDATAALPRGTQ